MALEDFEKSLADAKRAEQDERQEKSHRKRREHRHHHHRSHHNEDEDRHRHKRRRRSYDQEDDSHKRHKHRAEHKEPDQEQAGNVAAEDENSTERPIALKRDSWMEAPSALDVKVVHQRDDISKQPPAQGAKADFERKLHDSELNKHHIRDSAEDEAEQGLTEEPVSHGVEYLFGDAGSQWRMTKLKSVYRKAEETGQPIEEVAMQQYGDLCIFDDAREEEIELERRETYGEGYVGKEKPSGELFQERKLERGIRRSGADDGMNQLNAQIEETKTEQPVQKTVIGPTELNRLKAKMMKAKLRGASDAAKLEAKYNAEASGFIPTDDPGVVVLGTMENRMLAGGRQGEVRSVDNKRGRERGLVEENEDMSIADMVREERRTRHHAGGEGLRLAERIAKDDKFDVCVSPLGVSIFMY